MNDSQSTTNVDIDNLIKEISEDIQKDQSQKIATAVLRRLMSKKDLTFSELIAAFRVSPLKEHGQDLRMHDFLQGTGSDTSTSRERTRIDAKKLRSEITKIVNSKSNTAGLGKAQILERLPEGLRNEAVKKNLSAYIGALAAQKTIIKGGGQKRNMVYLPGPS